MEPCSLLNDVIDVDAKDSISAGNQYSAEVKHQELPSNQTDLFKGNYKGNADLFLDKIQTIYRPSDV